jgi:hypothetical protein
VRPYAKRESVLVVTVGILRRDGMINGAGTPIFPMPVLTSPQACPPRLGLFANQLKLCARPPRELPLLRTSGSPCRSRLLGGRDRVGLGCPQRQRYRNSPNPALQRALRRTPWGGPLSQERIIYATGADQPRDWSQVHISVAVRIAQ